MLRDLWRRLTGGRDDTQSVHAPASPSPASAPSATLAPGAYARPAEASPPGTAPLAATEESLRRSLQWRSKVLLDGLSRDARNSDGPALVEMLVEANDSVIRQPPAAAQRALEIARNPNSPLANIVGLFENDPMLAQSLLRQANSVYYRRDGTPCTSLHTGVQRVGLQGVQGILMASMVQNMLCRPGGAFDALVSQAWSHMQRTAPIARGIAPSFRLDPESAYSLALLHDVGKLIVFDHVSSLRHDKRRELKLPGSFLSPLLHHLHEPLGGLAVLRWGMGGEAAHAISEHHRRPAPETADPTTECLYVAEIVELAQSGFGKLDWEAIWTAGAITADTADVQERLARLEA